MKYRDILSSLVCIVIGLIFFIGSFKYGDIRKEIPSAGLFPFLGGTILIVLSLINLVIAIKKKEDGEVEIFFPYPYSMRRLALVLFSLIMFVIVLGYAGYFITSLLLILFLLRFIEPQKWLVNFLTSFLITALFYFIFIFFLKVQLPQGIFLEMLLKIKI
jgi:putative tricarboxylic transport membrane protein